MDDDYIYDYPRKYMWLWRLVSYTDVLHLQDREMILLLLPCRPGWAGML